MEKLVNVQIIHIKEILLSVTQVLVTTTATLTKPGWILYLVNV